MWEFSKERVELALEIRQTLDTDYVTNASDENDEKQLGAAAKQWSDDAAVPRHI